MASIDLHSLRIDVDKKYVGFTPNGASLKPVHVASGVQRTIFGGLNDDSNNALNIKRLALVYDAKGQIPGGNDLHMANAK